jgi:uncharacterized protein (DUF885 family)
MHAAEPLSHFVDAYLTYLYEACPTQATFDGVHLNDDLLEDYRRAAIDRHLGALAGFARRLDAIPSEGLTPSEQADRALVDANIRSRQFDLEVTRSWEKNPHIYADLVASSLAAQALFTYAPEEDRARRVLSKLRQVPRLILAARENVKEPPSIFVKIGLESWRGVRTFIDADIPRAFSRVDDLHLLADLADASTEAVQAIDDYLVYLENDLRPKAKGSFRLGRDVFEQKLRLDEGLQVSSERLLTLALRELSRVQDEFRQTAARLGPGDPLEIWAQVRQQHPAPGALIATAQDQLAQLRAFLAKGSVVELPAEDDVRVAPTPDFLRWSFASMWTPGPFETRVSRAVYCLTDVEPDWSPERKAEHLRDYNVPTLWNISMHEVYPGHYLHFHHLRRAPSKVRRSTLLAPLSYLEGWAHYCEEMMLEAGFGRGDHAMKLGQLGEALVRLARFVVCIKLHTDDWSVEQGVRFFRDEAYLEEAAARREAERGTFDPTYLVYSAGKLMLQKLRRDWMDEQSGKPTLRAFHDAFLAQGAATFPQLRRLLLTHADGDPLE